MFLQIYIQLHYLSDKLRIMLLLILLIILITVWILFVICAFIKKYEEEIQVNLPNFRITTLLGGVNRKKLTYINKLGLI